MRVLVTGASGFIGRHCLAQLAGHEIHALTTRPDRRSSAHVTWHPCDLLEDDVGRLIDEIRPSHLLHLAWYAHPGLYWQSLENYRWVGATLELLRAFGRHGTRAVIAGTSAEYDWSHGVLSEETTPLLPTSPYGICKHTTQLLATSFAQATGLSLAWGRIFAAYGPGEAPSKLISSAAAAFRDGHPFRIPAKELRRDYIHASDVARALTLLLESDLRGPVNIGTGTAVAISEIVARVRDFVGDASVVERDERASEEAPLVVADAARIRALGWEPRVDLETGIRQTVASLSSEPHG